MSIAGSFYEVARGHCVRADRLLNDGQPCRAIRLWIVVARRFESHAGELSGLGRFNAYYEAALWWARALRTKDAYRCLELARRTLDLDVPAREAALIHRVENALEGLEHALRVLVILRAVEHKHIPGFFMVVREHLPA